MLLRLEQLNHRVTRTMLKSKLHLKADSRSIKFAGAMHSHDPKDPAFEEIEQLFEQGETPRVMLVEGWEKLRFSADIDVYRKTLSETESLSRDELIRRYGDAGIGVHLARRYGIPIFCPEPSFKEEIKHVSSLGFDRDHIFASYHARLIYQYRMEATGQSLGEWLSPHIADFARASGWRDYDCSFEQFLRVSAEIWPSIKSFDELDQWSVVEIMAPTTSPLSPLYTPVNLVAKEEMAYRDACILNDTIQFLRMCDHVFLIYGRGHLATLETPLKLALERCFDSVEEIAI